MYQNRLYLLLCLVFAVDTTLSTTVMISSQPTLAAPSLSSSIVSVDSSPSTTPVQDSTLLSSTVVASPSTTPVHDSSLLSSTVVASPSATPFQDSSQLSSKVVAVTTSTPPVQSNQSVAFTTAPLSVTTPSFTASSSLGASLTSSVQATGAQPTKPSTGTSATGTKDTKNDELKIVGYVIGPIVGGLVIVFIVYFFVVRKRSRNMAIGNDTSMEALAPSGKAATSQKAGPEAGTTHQAFVGDSDGPNKGTVSAAQGVKVA